ncbi:MAG: hypothetical protein MJK18_06610 [Bdellovibrionales bacterium]|nr:hypothetical protein [Bdellovibrionales bacterium]
MRIMLIVSFLVLASCASRKTLEPDSNMVESSGVVKVWANWVKDKGKKYDIQFAIENVSKKSLIIYLRDIKCFRGEAAGRLRHTFFNTGERTMDFHEGEMKQFNMVCSPYKKEARGPFKILIKKVYDNPEDDGETKGKVIATDIEWTLAEFRKERPRKKQKKNEMVF